MPRSMTSFARSTAHHEWGSITCEIRSVNHRFLEVNFRLPETLRELEMVLREKARKKLGRGKIDCSFQLTFNNNNSEVNADLGLAKKYIDIAQKIATEIDQPGLIPPLEVMKWPGILKNENIDIEHLKSAANDIFIEASDDLIRGREREGEKLCEMIEQRLIGISAQTTVIRENLPGILANQRHRLNEKMSDFVPQLDTDRLEQEMVIIANRSDVDEELDRLEAHLIEIRRVLKKQDSIGRRLDFLMQELNREANTLGSKSIAGVTTNASVELKVLIEQMREQIQNIE